MSYLLWISIFGALYTICNAFQDPKLQFTFVPESHPNWHKLDHKNCGFSLKSRIIGGKEANLGQYPWIIRMGRSYVDEQYTLTYFSCGGVILNRYYIITAAHCFLKAKTFPNFVRVGEYDTTTDPDCVDNICGPSVQDIPILECYVPKYFTPKILETDLALCLLETPIAFNELASPLCMLPYSLSSANTTGMVSEVAGWGLVNVFPQLLPTVLQTLRLTIVDDFLCKENKKNHVYFPSNILCAGGKMGEDSCTGDSGGPLMIESSVSGARQYYLLGVVSYGPVNCGAEPVPAVYTKIAQFQSWILDLLVIE